MNSGRSISGEWQPTGNRESSEADLVSRVRAGDPTAMEAIHRAYWSQLVDFAEEYGAFATREARAIVAETFLDVWRHREGWKPDHGILSHLLGAVGRRIRRSSRPGMGRLFGPTPTPFEPVTQLSRRMSDLRATVAIIIDSMPTRCREVYHLRHTYNLDVYATAHVLHLATATVRRHHARALHLLVQGLVATDWAAAIRQRYGGA